MSIRPLFKPSDIKANLKAKIAKIEKVTEVRLTTVGLKFVNDARQKADFTDRTGNLRSSIGFVLMKDGKSISEDFEQTKEGPIGKAQAIVYAIELSRQYQGRYTLIVVAGMEYAAAVESKGFDVLTGSSIEATNKLNKYFKNKQ